MSLARRRPSSSAMLRVRVRRQPAPERASSRRWEEFELEVASLRTVAEMLHAINEAPRTMAGEATEPIAFGPCADEPPCGGCAMLIGGRARLACRTNLDEVRDRRGRIVLEPLSELPLLADLAIDRSVLHANAAKLGLDAEQSTPATTRDDVSEHPGPPGGDAARALLSELGRCTHCALCLEACPEYRRDGRYVGAAAFVNAERAALGGAISLDAWRAALLGPAAITRCGQTYNCHAVGPEEIALDRVLARAHRAASRKWLGELLRRRRR